MKRQSVALGAALAGNIILLAVVAGLWWQPRAPASALAVGGPPSGVPKGGPTEPVEPPRAPLQISPQRLQSIGVQSGVVQSRRVDEQILAAGNIAVDETRLAYVQARFSGYIQQVLVNATYQYVRKGQPLFTVYSPELVATEHELLVARQNRQQLAHSTDAQVARDAASLVVAAAERLAQWNVPQREIARLEAGGGVRQALEIDSPVSGYVTEREALPNKYVQPDTRLYTVADLSAIWVFAQVPQNDLGRLKSGDSATLTVDAYPGRVFSGRVDFVYPDIDMTTRTARVRLTFPNPDLKLMPGMFVSVSLAVPMGEQIVIPATGVLQTGSRQIVFVDEGGGVLQPREVQLGDRAGDYFIVLKGLKAGEAIVTSANFLIDSESQLQAALGTFTPPPPGTGTAEGEGASQAKVELATEPNPPQKGSNRIRIKLGAANGAALTDAQVTATFFMAAMPAMGMAAMRVPVTLSDKGNGVYEGTGQFPSGGSWQVTIVAKKNGQAIATQQLSVTVTGGM